jgi:hypothetical protein
MNALIAIQARTLRDIALELNDVKAQLAVHYARRCDPTPDEDDEWSELEDRRSGLEADFAATFHVLTGMRWSQAEQVMG